ncbi:hypothetical protein JAO76_15035 [Pontibacter sp. BT310]|uniref:hypothetical protein n=1 Tax=Pontibacter humidus TaxID=2795728 RepID=UPI0018EBD2AC|nr:hypothetical protein [Pontibacter sp. BT310]MBJ6119522.1 hypothetical protein [Pontibacter sp. BT310]
MISSIGKANYSLLWEASRLIVVVVLKGQVNLPLSWAVTIANSDFSFVEITDGKQ